MKEALCDLVLLTWDHLEETQPCVESLLRHTDVPSRLLIVDNGSVSPAKEFVQSVRPAGSIVEVQVLRNSTNEGYPRGMNRGLRESTAPYVCLLNNDLLFSPRWLSEMIAVAASDAAIGIVNPSSGTLGQKLLDGQTPEQYATTLTPLRGQRIAMGAAIGFCMLITRGAKERVGLMDEHFGMGYFEDTDYCFRAREADFSCVRAKASYVHHKENRSFKDTWASKQAQDRHFDESRKKFVAKWGKLERQAYIVAANGSLQWLTEEVQRHANRDARIVVFAPARHGRPPLPEHMNITHAAVPDAGFGLRVLWRIVQKKKKYDRIVVNHPGLARAFQRLRWIHRAQVEVW